MSFNDGFNIRAVPWPANTPVSGNSLVYDGTKWVAADISGSGGGGTGDITAVNAGTNLTGGGSSGDVTVSLSTSVTGLTNLQTTNLTASHMSGTDLKIDYIDFNTASIDPVYRMGRLHFNANNADLSYDTDVSGVYFNYGQQLAVKVKNNTGASIAKGKLVSISGGLGNNPTIVTASWDSENLSANTIGMMMNTAGINEFAYVLLNGVIEGVDTADYNGGTGLYLSSSGDYTSTVPVPPKHQVRIGNVVREQSNNGSIFIKIQNGYEVNELHDVLVSSIANGDVLAWDNGSSVWKNTKTLSGSYLISGSFVTNKVGNSIRLVVSGGLFSTLQQAIDVSSDREIILVGPTNTSWGDITLPTEKRISIVGLAAKNTPTLVKVGKVTFSPTGSKAATFNEIHLENLYINSTDTGSCVYVDGTADCRLKIEGCYINISTGGSGNGVFVNSGSNARVYLDNCFLLGENQLTGAGLFAQSGLIYIRNCDFDGFKNSIYVSGSNVLSSYVELGLTKFTTRNLFEVIKIDKGTVAGNSIYIKNEVTGTGVGIYDASTGSFTNSIFDIPLSATGYAISGSGQYYYSNNITVNTNYKLQNTIVSASFIQLIRSA